MKKILLCLSLSLLLTTLIYRAPALSMSHEEIFKWVAQELEIEKDYPMPQIIVVSKAELQRVFKKDSEKSYQRWVEEYGENKAKETMDLYLNDLLGLFNPKAKVIYVGSFMEQCKFNSIVAHEITHYFQVLEEGTIDPQSTGFDYTHLFREMQASKIMDMYMKAFCVSLAGDGEMASKH
ncbi:MAG: hypothetical protein V3W19_16545 [Desulfatiglandales bacterium]